MNAQIEAEQQIVEALNKAGTCEGVLKKLQLERSVVTEPEVCAALDEAITRVGTRYGFYVNQAARIREARNAESEALRAAAVAARAWASSVYAYLDAPTTNNYAEMSKCLAYFGEAREAMVGALESTEHVLVAPEPSLDRLDDLEPWSQSSVPDMIERRESDMRQSRDSRYDGRE